MTTNTPEGSRINPIACRMQDRLAPIIAIIAALVAIWVLTRIGT